MLYKFQKGGVMHLKEQLYICTIAECGNITKAAEKLFITQPALSLYINNLEKMFGVKLFDRVEKQFIPTAAGKLYVDKAKQMLSLQQEFEASLGDLKNHVDGVLHIGVQLRRAPLLLPTVMARFKMSYPNIRIDVKEGVKTDLEEFLKSNQIQLLLYNAEQPREDLINKILYVDRPLIAIPADHSLNARAVEMPGSHYRYLDLNFCQDEFFILPTARQSLRQYIDKVFLEQHFYTYNKMEIRNFETAIRLVNEGYGLAFNREQYKKSMVDLSNVKYYAFTYGKNEISRVFVGYKKHRELPKYIHYFIQLLSIRGKEIEALD